MKALVFIIYGVTAFLVCSEALQCYFCREATLQECENNSTIKNCTEMDDACMTRDAVLSNGTYSFTMVKKDCIQIANLQSYCLSGVFSNQDGVPITFTNVENCTAKNCTGDLCNGSPATTTAMPTTSAPSTGEPSTSGSTQTASTTRPGLVVPQCPTGCCGTLIVNIVVVAILSFISLCV